MERIIDHLVQKKKAYFIAAVIAVLLMLLSIRNPGFNSAFEELGIQDNEYVDNTAHIDSIFGEKQKIFAIFTPHYDHFGPVIKDIESFQAEIQSRFPEAKIQSPIDLVKHIVPSKVLAESSVQAILSRVASIDLLKEGIAIDSSSFLVKIGIDVDDQAVINNKLQDAWNSVENKEHYTVYFAGLPLLEHAMNETLLKDILYILIILFICFALIMYVSYRSKFATMYLLGMVTASLISGVFVYTLSGESFNFVGIMVLPVVVVLAAANAVHLLTGYFSLKEGSYEERIRLVYSKYLLPSFLTTITTAFAFFTLTLTSTKSVYTLGWVCAVTILINFLVCFSATPFLLQYAPKRNIKDHPFSKFAQFFIRNKKIFALFQLPILFIAIYLIPSLGFKNNFELFVPSNSEASVAIEKLTSRYYVQSDVSIVLDGPDSLSTVQEIQRLRGAFENIELVKTIIDANTPSIVFTPILLPIDLSNIPAFRQRYEANNGTCQRIQLKTATPADLISIEQKINTILESIPKPFTVTKSSAELMYEYVNREVGASLIKSMLSSSIFLLFVFLFLTRSILQSLIGLFVNFVPLSMIVILFVGLDLQINIMTSLTAIVCIGLIVDDTIHSFYRRVIMREPLKELSFGMLTTTIILTMGFGVFAISSLQPIVIFGGIAAVIFVITLISDLTLLLYLIELYDEKIGLKEKTV